MDQPKFARSVRLLLVEDSPSDVRLMREALRDTQLVVHLSVAHDGAEAVDLLETCKAGLAPLPDLILLDLNLPKKNGREVLSEVKRDEVLKKIPVLVMTSSTDDDEISEVYNLNANCYIRKPSDLYEYERVVRSIEDFWLLTVLLPDSDSIPPSRPGAWPRSASGTDSLSSRSSALHNSIG
jgi:two-component system, chemotaxis family, response regulator Rcp1